VFVKVVRGGQRNAAVLRAMQDERRRLHLPDHRRDVDVGVGRPGVQETLARQPAEIPGELVGQLARVLSVTTVETKSGSARSRSPARTAARNCASTSLTGGHRAREICKPGAPALSVVTGRSNRDYPLA